MKIEDPDQGETERGSWRGKKDWWRWPPNQGPTWFFPLSWGGRIETDPGAIHKGKDIALANKETMVMAGEVVTKAARQSGSRILPSIVSIARYSNACRAAPTPRSP